MTTHAIDAGTNRVVELAGLTPGKTNFIYVTAYNAQRVESDPSEARYYCPRPAALPAAAPGDAISDPARPGRGRPSCGWPAKASR